MTHDPSYAAFCSAYRSPLQRLFLGNHPLAIVVCSNKNDLSMQTRNWKWLALIIAVMLTIVIMVMRSQQRIKALDRQLDHSQTK